MVYKFAVLGGDARARYLTEELRRLGHTVHTFSVPDLPNTDETLQDTLHRGQYVILPMGAPPVSAEMLPTDVTVFAPNTSLPCAKNYLAWETLAIANAVPTAEGAIQLAMEHMPTTLFGSRFLIVGAGRIGMFLAQKLQALGANVTVSARKPTDKARISALGLTADTTGIYSLGLDRYDCIFNTVPAPVFTLEQLPGLRKDCILIELASAPGGFPKEIPVISGAALPGRMSPKTAGVILAREILNHII